LRLATGVNPIAWLVVGIGTVGLLALSWAILLPLSGPRPELPRTRFIEPADVDLNEPGLFVSVERDNTVWLGNARIDKELLEETFVHHRAASRREWAGNGERSVTYGPVVLKADRRAEWRALRPILAAAARANVPRLLIKVVTWDPDFQDYLVLVLADAEPPDPSSAENRILSLARREAEVLVNSTEVPDSSVLRRRRADTAASRGDRLGPRMRLDLDGRTSLQDVVALLEHYGDVVSLVGFR